MKKFLKIFILTVLAIGALTGFINWVVGRVEIPKQLKLTDCTNATLKVKLTVPKGHHFQLVYAQLETDDKNTSNTPPFQLSGHIQISPINTSVALFSFTPETSEKCNWLQLHGFQKSYILTWNPPTNTLRFSHLLQRETQTELKIVFDQPPPANSSLWLAWLQDYKDRDK
jgi:hypothetical protein